MTTRKRKPVKIPNAPEVAKCLADYPQFHEAQALAVERGRTIGRLEGLADAFECPWDAKSIVGVSAQSRALLAPILRAEIARLKEQP